MSLPDIKNYNNIFASLIKEFRKQGHNVSVSTKGIDILKTKLEIEDSIPVIRIKSHDFTGVNNNLKKALAYQEYSLKQCWYTYKYFKKEKIDLIISHSLPPELSFVVGNLKKKFRCPFYLIQSDYTWQDAVAFNYFSEKGPIALYYKYWEKKLLLQADYIGCPTKGNISFIKKYYPEINDSHFRFLPFWQKKVEFHKQVNLKDKFGLKDKFVVIYGGSVGAAQRIEHMLELAEACTEYKDIAFVILGKGAYLSTLKEMAREKKLTNVIFKDFLPQVEYLNFLASCDVGMIILNEKMATPNFPSKSLSYLNMKVPILAALDYTTDFGKYLEDNNAGLWGYSDDIEMLKSKLLMYYNSKDYCDLVKESGYKLFVNNLLPEHAYNTIMKDFECK